MSLAVVYTRANCGLEAPLVTVETHLSNGLPGMAIVGLPETVVRESRERVRSAIINSGMTFPARRITVNLAPAELPKSGGRFDLAIALGILAASAQIPGNALARYEVLGELALTGQLRAVDGVLPALLAARDNERTLLIPAANAEEASLLREVNAISAGDLLAICRSLQSQAAGDQLHKCRYRPPARSDTFTDQPRLQDIHGHHLAKRAMMIAAAGAHNVLLCGPPGIGKTLLVNAMHGLLPPLTEEEALDVAAIRSVAGSGQRRSAGDWYQAPCRSPHHSTTGVAIVGGGRNSVPGEVSLAHRGVLFLDELPEFPRAVLETLREPLESGRITISRVHGKVCYPARFQFLAAMNPCPCGYATDETMACRCTAARIRKYLDRLSGPLLDRLDMTIAMERPTMLLSGAGLPGSGSSGASAQDDARQNVLTTERVREQVLKCRDRQRARGVRNAELTGESLLRHCALASDGQRLFEDLLRRRQLSVRTGHRLLRVARTIADLEDADNLAADHVAEAIGMRQLDVWLQQVAAPAAVV